MTTFPPLTKFRAEFSSRAQFSPLGRQLPRVTRASIGALAPSLDSRPGPRLPRLHPVNASTGWDPHLLDRLQTPITRFHD